MKNRILCALLFIALISFAGCNARQYLLTDFVNLDKSYVPALFLTNKEKSDPSKKAVGRLITEWVSFKGKYYDFNKDDEQWSRDFDTVEQSIRAAEKIVSSNGDLIEAYEILKNVRHTFIKTRRRNNIEYYIDYLTDFHSPMDHITAQVMGKKPEALTGKNIDEIKEALPEAKRLWEALKNAEFDEDLFVFNKDKVKEMQKLVLAVTKNLEELESAVKSKPDKAKIIELSLSTGESFSFFFMLFGNFHGLGKI
ncbi:MAG: hypothetical protein JW864_02980 [Spirochaetes bacterium]|nr:hypothetical protein [Spirochaetota bacterium]